jgi:hypothetical protein
MLAFWHRLQGQPEKAERWFLRAIEIDPDDQFAVVRLRQLRLRAHRRLARRTES